MERILTATSSRTDPSSPSDPSDPDSHKNEGFLKSIWHTLTNHPAHQKNGEAESAAPTDSKEEETKKADDTKKDEQPK